MFLFTTPPPSRAPDAGSPVIDAIRQGAERTGTSFDYLLDTARRESALDPAAKASTSSATGLFQFIEQTWLGLVKSEGAKIGLAEEAEAVTARGDGTLTVQDQAARQAILKLREDPQIAAVLAGALTQQNRDAVAASIGRDPTTGELYLAHVFGPRGAANLIGAAQSDPDRAAALGFPEAARANRGIFYRRDGQPRTNQEVYGLLTAAASGGKSREAPAGQAPAQAGGERPVMLAATAPQGLRGLFQTGGVAPISDAVARIWRVNNGAGAGRAATAASFFPRTLPVVETAPDETQDEDPARTVAAGQDARSVAPAADPNPDAPLPPRRPAAEEPDRTLRISVGRPRTGTRSAEARP